MVLSVEGLGYDIGDIAITVSEDFVNFGIEVTGTVSTADGVPRVSVFS